MLHVWLSYVCGLVYFEHTCWLNGVVEVQMFHNLSFYMWLYSHTVNGTFDTKMDSVSVIRSHVGAQCAAIGLVVR